MKQPDRDDDEVEAFRISVRRHHHHHNNDDDDDDDDDVRNSSNSTSCRWMARTSNERTDRQTESSLDTVSASIYLGAYIYIHACV